MEEERRLEDDGRVPSIYIVKSALSIGALTGRKFHPLLHHLPLVAEATPKNAHIARDDAIYTARESYLLHK